jgi:transcriptional regulator with XRE-family HTH domain
MTQGTAVSRLRRAREDQGRRLREVAREARLDPGLLSKIERGRVQPSPKVLLRLAVVLGLRDVERTLSEFYSDGQAANGQGEDEREVAHG